MARKTDSYGLISSALLVWMRYYWERQILQYPSKPISKLSALIGTSNVCSGASLMAQRLKHLPPMQETRFQSLGGKMPWKRKWQSTPVFLPGESPGRRSLVGYSPQGRKESDTTEQLHLHLWRNNIQKLTYEIWNQKICGPTDKRFKTCLYMLNAMSDRSLPSSFPNCTAPPGSPL